MKKIIYIYSIIVIALGVSCDDDGGTSVITLEDGVVPNMQKSTTTDAFINLIKVLEGENVSIGFSAEVAQGNPASTSIIGVYYSGSNVYSATLFDNVSLPGDFTLSVNDIVAAFTELSGTDDILLGDKLSISISAVRSDGTELNLLNPDGTDNFNSNIKNSGLFTTVINYSVSCPSDIGGIYDVVSSGFSTDGAPINNPMVNFPYTVTVTDNGGGSYTVSDGVAGVYQEWYCAPYGYCFETEGSFLDVCGTLSGSWTEAFGCPIELTGLVNGNGTLTISWSNCFGDTIEEAIYTPQ